MSTLRRSAKVVHLASARQRNISGHDALILNQMATSYVLQ